MRELRVLVLGAGAIGSFIGGRLVEAGIDVTFADQWCANVDALRRNGTTLPP